MEANSTVNLVPFGEGITELRMCKSCNFVLSVNILTLLAVCLDANVGKIKRIDLAGWCPTDLQHLCSKVLMNKKVLNTILLQILCQPPPKFCNGLCSYSTYITPI